MNIKLLLWGVAKFFLAKPLALLIGVASYVPGLLKIFNIGTGGTISARYCYTVWLRHLTIAHKNGLSPQLDTIAELGPGDSIGIGLAALISGANKYYALDAVKYARNKRNIKIFDELVTLFKAREKIPDEIEFPRIKFCLDSYDFPSHILTEKHLGEALKQDRLDSIRKALLNLDGGDENGIQISYCVPWYDLAVVKENSIDMIYSQAVMEHVDNLDYTYEVLHRWLKPSGFLSQDVDFRSHGTASKWNGHWGYSDFVWKLMRGKLPYLLNRRLHSEHINLLEKFGFKIVCDLKTKDTSGIKRESLAPKFKDMSDDDLITSTAFIQAIKTPRA